jgi:hypothetical protein
MKKEVKNGHQLLIVFAGDMHLCRFPAHLAPGIQLSFMTSE